MFDGVCSKYVILSKFSFKISSDKFKRSVVLGPTLNISMHGRFSLVKLCCFPEASWRGVQADHECLFDNGGAVLSYGCVEQCGRF